MKRVGRLFFLLTFAFLQCVSPLAHAHFGEDASGGPFHAFHFNDASQKHAHDHTTRISSGGHGHSASDVPLVKVPDGKRRVQAGIVVVAPVLDQGGMRFALPAMPRKPAVTEDVRAALPLPYLTQYAQAPPQHA